MAVLSYWRMNGNSNDAVGNKNGTDTNMSYSGGINGAAVYNGSSSKILISAPLNGQVPNMMLSARVKTTNGAAVNTPFIAQRDLVGGDVGVYGSFRFGLYSGSFNFFDYGTSAYGFNLNSGAVTIHDDKWHHIAFVKINGTAGYLLDNGKIVGQASGTNTSYTGTLNAGIGYDVRDNLFWSGSIDEMKISNNSSFSAIKNEYAKLKGFF